LSELGVLGLGVLLVVYLVGVPGLVALALAATRRRWPHPVWLVPVWLCSSLAVHLATALLASLLGFLPMVGFVVYLKLFGATGYLSAEPEPLFGLWLGGTWLGALAWCLGVWMSALLSGLRGSILARLWVLATLLLGFVWATSALLGGSTLIGKSEEVYQLIFLLALAGVGVAELALLGVLGLMSLPGPRGDPAV
jgi:hypothetical protein